MKCLILAGGRGERLWPLSRKNFPKQFIEIQKNHSVFQETVARNIPYCDEFIIVTNYEYRDIIANQMKAFQGIPYTCVFEESPRKTTAAIVLACLGLQSMEYVFVVAADHLLDTRMMSRDDALSYKDAILKAKTYAADNAIAIFARQSGDLDSRFGYVQGIAEDGSIGEFIEKPDKYTRLRLEGKKDVYQNLGMLVFQNGTLKKQMLCHAPELLRQCECAYNERQILGSHVYYPEDVQNAIDSVAIEKSLLENTDCLRAVRIGFDWNDIGSLEDLSKTQMHSDGVVVSHNCSNMFAVNQSPNQAVVMNGLDDVVVVNTPDAVYVGKYGSSSNLKEIMHSYEELIPYTQKGTIFYRQWGYYERYVEEQDYRLQKIVLFPGKTIYQHKHLKRTEKWMVVRGNILMTLDGVQKIFGPGEYIEISAGCEHQASNVGQTQALILETAIGEFSLNTDLYAQRSHDVAEIQLGLGVEPMIKLKPAYKDAIWGGTKLRDRYKKDCDYDVISESWELSAHAEGQSTVASGRHKGMKFGRYLDTVGWEVLGWKSNPLQSFPLLVKFIDARGNLSVQVHPDDDYALEIENQYGKNEMWYVIDSEPGAGLYVGFNKDVTREEVERRVKDNSIMEVLNFYHTKPGDVFFIPAGTVHAIGAGNLICEIQQSSSCTYRLYDYDRRDKFGNPRTLHLEKALDVLSFKKYEPVGFHMETAQSERTLCKCKYFESVIYEINGEERIQLQNDRFCSIICVNGSGILNIGNASMEVAAGESIFVPASEAQLLITGSLSVIISNI